MAYHYFSCRTYKAIINEDWKSHANAVNEDWKYCQTIKDPFEFRGRCKDIDLPSYHPYWGVYVTIKAYRAITHIRETIEQHRAMKHVGNAFGVRQMIDDAERNIKWNRDKFGLRVVGVINRSCKYPPLLILASS